MRQFYECTGKVIIYLGEKSGNTDTAIWIIRTLVEIAYYNSDARDCPEFVAEFKIFNLQMEIPRYDSPDWRAFSDFFARDWFGRVWVIQEAVVGREDTVAIVGTRALTWSMIGVAADWSHGNGGYQGLVQIGEDRDDWSYHALLIQRCRWELQQDDKVTSFLAALMNARNFRATEERDKVFSLVGLRDRLWGRPGGAEFQIDYEKGTAEVFRDAARHLIEETMSLDVLANIEDHCGRKRKDLPSWAQDWTKPMDCASFSTATKLSNYKACGDSGVVLLEMMIHQREEVEGPPQTYTVLRSQWNAIASKLEPYPGGGSALDAFWRTLIANVDRLRSPVGNDYFFHFARYIHALPGGPSGIDAAVKESLAAREIEKGDEVMKAGDGPSMKGSDSQPGFILHRGLAAAVGRRFLATKRVSWALDRQI
jgi:hypothetical protein